MVCIKNFKCIALAVILASSGVLPLYSSAAVTSVIPEPTVKEKAVLSGASLSVPKFRIMEGADGNKLIMTPAVGGVNKAQQMGELPVRYDLLDTGRVTSVKNQGGFGTCWTHAAIASAESDLALAHPNIDLSEFHTAFYTYYKDGMEIKSREELEALMNFGGNCFYVANEWSQWNGPVIESRFPYGDLGFFDDLKNSEIKRTESAYHMRNAYMFDYNEERSDVEEVNRLVKEFVYGGNVVDVSFQSDNAGCYSPEFNSTRSERKPKFSNHAVAIVGWDDEFPKENFLKPAECDGAWLVKNSWGEEAYDSGYMWISYDDRSLCEFAVFDMDSDEEYSDIFCHDNYVSIQSMSADEPGDEPQPSYMANVFHADEEMQVEAASFYVPYPGTEYEITVYSSLTDISDPVSGIPSKVTYGRSDVTGDITFELDEDVVIGAGEDFSIVAKAYCPDYPYVIPIESTFAVYDSESDSYISLGGYCTYEQIQDNTGENESFYSVDGVGWNDIKYEVQKYSEAEKAEVLEELKNDLYDGIYPDETELLENADSRYNFYKYLFELGDLYVYIGNISLKAYGNPVNTVDFSEQSGIIGEAEKIELSVKDGEDIYYSVNGGETELYEAPIEVKDTAVIRATTDFEHYTERSYISASNAPEIGDVNADGLVDASDASDVLTHYSMLSTGSFGTLGKAYLEYADMTNDGLVDANDASLILTTYSILSTM